MYGQIQGTLTTHFKSHNKVINSRNYERARIISLNLQRKETAKFKKKQKKKHVFLKTIRD